MGWKVAIALAAGLACFGSHSSRAAPGAVESSSVMSFGQPVPVPVGYYNLCMSQPSVCRPRSGRVPRTAPGAIHMTPDLLEKLETVTVAVNRAIRPVADPDAPGIREWRVRTAAGNCKDYALAKRQQLLADGLPTSALLVAIARLNNGEQHAVLVVRTDMGDYLLDNLNDGVRPWRRAPYNWEKIQSPVDTWTWHAL